MPKARKPPQPKPQQLLVEGKNDRQVIWALCQQYHIISGYTEMMLTVDSEQ
jgi:hypothetical protein